MLTNNETLTTTTGSSFIESVCSTLSIINSKTKYECNGCQHFQHVEKEFG